MRVVLLRRCDYTDDGFMDQAELTRWIIAIVRRRNRDLKGFYQSGSTFISVRFNWSNKSNW